MAYCTVEEVQAEFKSLQLDGGGVLSSTVLGQWIDQADAYINGKVGLKYQVPVSGTESVKICKSMSIMLVTERVKGKLRVKTGKPEDEQNGLTSAKKTVETMLADIIANKLLLSDATLLNSSNGASDYNSSHDVEHQFKINRDQW